MTKEADVAALLGGNTTKSKAKPAAKKAAAPAKEAKPAKKVAALESKPAASKPAAKEAKPARVKEPVVFEEGERDELIAKIKRTVKKPINSKDLALKLEVATRKLRRVLYSAQKQGIVNLELGASASAGMTVSPA